MTQPVVGKSPTGGWWTRGAARGMLRPEAINMKMEERLTALRRSRGLSQEALADALRVSRQAVGKWERGEAAPELPKLVEIADYYGVTLDAIAREGECAAAPVPGSGRDLEALVSFLIRAKRATYAGYGGEVSPSRPSSHDLAYREGAFAYYDTYLGGERFVGEEAVWVEGRPAWGMNYAGRVLSPGFSGGFLKEALSAVPADAPFRGPALYRRGELTYHCAASGDFPWFEGVEAIFSGDEKTYECRFHGGLVQ